MSHRSKVLLWSRNTARSAEVKEALGNQGVALGHVDTAPIKGVTFANTDANALIIDFKTQDPVTEQDFKALWSSAHAENLKVIYLADSLGGIPEFAPREDDSVHVLAGPALEQQLYARIRHLTRLDTMAEEINRRSSTLNAFGIDTPYNPSSVQEKPGKILLYAEPSKRFLSLENALTHSGNEIIGAYTKQMALEFLESENFDLILFEVNNDREDLLNFIRSIRLDTRFYNIPTIVLSKQDQIGDAEEVYKAGITEIILEPVDDKDLASISQSLIREYHYHRHLSSIYYAADHDSVMDAQTGLFRFGFMMDHLTEQLIQVSKSDISLTVAFFDILKLDSINEEFGYAAGDSVIRQVGSMTSRFFRGEDLCARLDGDEFVTIMPRTRITEAAPAIRRLVATINATRYQVSSGVAPINLCLTFGLTEYQHGDTARTIIERARKASRPG